MVLSMVLSLPSALLLVLSCSLDNLVVGMMYGIRGISIPFSSNLLIAGITSGGTLVCIFTGRLVAGFLTSAMAHSIGSLGIALTGAWVLIREASDQRGTPPQGDCQRPSGASTRIPSCSSPALSSPSLSSLSLSALSVSSLAMILEDPFIGEVSACGRLGAREGCFLGLALSLNNFPNGLAAGVAGSNLAVMTVSLVILSMLTLWAGLAIGRRRLTNKLKDASGTIAGLILLGAGIYELLA